MSNLSLRRRRQPVVPDLDTVWGPATYTAASLGPFAHPLAHSRILLHYSPSGGNAPSAIRKFALRTGLAIVEGHGYNAVITQVRRAYPAAVIIDGSPPSSGAFQLCDHLKQDTLTSVVPVVVYMRQDSDECVASALEAGADEVLTSRTPNREADLRLELALHRAERDVSVHPTTLMPGTIGIQRDFSRRVDSGETFAVCYADIDHFKEYNDRYGYHCGDRVILILSRIIRDIVLSLTPDSFVGHIGGDDFIFSGPLAAMPACCEEIIEAFDALIPAHYDPADRERGYFVGKDRRGREYDVPLMTLSIGVVTNEHRDLAHPAQISELATEMKTYAKSFAGSNYVVDRRADGASAHG